VKRFVYEPAVNVNWGDPQHNRTGFYRACSHGCVSVVKFLLNHPLIDITKQQSQGFTAFAIACQNNYPEVVSLLLKDPRINVNKATNDGYTAFPIACLNGNPEVVSLLLADPRIDVNESDKLLYTSFHFACQNGHKEVVSLLLADLRVDVVKPNTNQCSPLWKASQNGYLPVVQLILASEREVDTKTKSIAGPAPWNNKTAAEQARSQGTRVRPVGESGEVFYRKTKNGPLIADLLDSFNADPETTRQQLREVPGIRDSFIGDLFALVVFLCDDLLAVKAEPSSSTSFPSTTSKTTRFFQIARCLPMELQMVLCNCVFGARKNAVLTKHSEPAFKKLGSLLAWSERQ